MCNVRGLVKLFLWIIARVGAEEGSGSGGTHPHQTQCITNH